MRNAARFNNKSQGFTLIELLVVIALIGVLAATSLFLLNPALQFKKSRDARRKADLSSIQAGLELYRADQGAYPTSITCNSALSVGVTIYLKIVPCDPQNTGQLIYHYVPGSPPNTYSLIACLENTNDPQKDSINNSTYCAGGSANWSYTVSNP